MSLYLVNQRRTQRLRKHRKAIALFHRSGLWFWGWHHFECADDCPFIQYGLCGHIWMCSPSPGLFRFDLQGMHIGKGVECLECTRHPSLAEDCPENDCSLASFRNFVTEQLTSFHNKATLVNPLVFLSQTKVVQLTAIQETKLKMRNKVMMEVSDTQRT